MATLRLINARRGGCALPNELGYPLGLVDADLLDRRRDGHCLALFGFGVVSQRHAVICVKACVVLVGEVERVAAGQLGCLAEIARSAA